MDAMFRINYDLVEWSKTPELARSLYSAFKNRNKHDLQNYVQDADSLWVVGKLEGKHLACAMCVDLFPALFDYREATFIKFLWTPTKYRCRGFAHHMLETAYRHFGPLSLTVREANEYALNFYLNRGFVPVEREHFMSYQGRILFLYKD